MNAGHNGNGSRRPEEIQAAIARTRREMDGTLSALENRLTPGQLYDQGVQYLRNNGGTEFVSNLGQQAKQNPLPVALVGIGLAWLMATRNSGTEPELGEPGLMEKASQAKARLGERATQARDTTRQQIDRAKTSLDTMMREQPLAIGAIGLAIGALAAALAPRTQKEEELVGRMNEVANPQEKEQAEYPDLSVDPLKKARDEERERLQAGVKPYAERPQSEPPV